MSYVELGRTEGTAQDIELSCGSAFRQRASAWVSMEISIVFFFNFCYAHWFASEGL